MRILKFSVFILILFSLGLIGCSQGSSSGQPNVSEGGGAPPSSDAAEIAQLNALPVNGGGLSIHFDEVDFADLLSVPVDPILPIGPTPQIIVDPILQNRARISGRGTINWPVISSQPLIFDGLFLTVAFNASITNGQGCLASAQQALNNKDQLDIDGTGILIPFDFGWAAMSESSSSGAPQSAIGQLNSTAMSISSNIIVRPPFISLIVAALLNSISQCSVGAADVPPVASGN
jgi:hypothetical protein